MKGFNKAEYQTPVCTIYVEPPASLITRWYNPIIMTQLQRARDGEVTDAMERVAERENRDPEFVREQVANGQAVRSHTTMR